MTKKKQKETKVKEIKKKELNKEKEYSKLFKKCMNIFVEDLATTNDFNFPTFTITDIEYSDGYWLYGYDKDSVVHFHVKECPGWKFGIWFDEPKIEYETEKGVEFCREKVATGQFFGQYEETINKFKPAASRFCARLYFNLLDNDYDYFDAYGQLQFIMREPYLAFYRDHCYADFNTFHVTRREAKKHFKDYQKRKKRKNKYTKICDDKMLKFVNETIVPFYKGAKIVDSGEDSFPRYMVIAPFELNRDLFDERGLYDFEDEIGKEFDKVVRKCEKIASKHEILWMSPIHDVVNIYIDESPKRKKNKKAK